MSIIARYRAICHGLSAAFSESAAIFSSQLFLLSGKLTAEN